KNFIFHNLYKEFMSATKALNKPLAQLDFKPLSNEIKALPYKANANLKAHLRDINAKTNELLDSMQEFKNTTKEIKLLPYNKPSENKANEVDRFSNVLDSKPLQHESFVKQDLRKRVWQEGEHYDDKNPKYFDYKYLDNKEIINVPDFALSDRGKAIKRVVAEEPKQRELIEQINAGQTEKFDEFIAKEREAIQALGYHLGDKEGMQRFIDMANMLKDDKLKWQYLHRIVKDTEDIRYLMEETSPMLEKAYRDVSKKLDSKIEAERAKKKALKEAEKAAEIERIANYDLETAYKEKAHLEKIMQSNRNDYSPYSFSPAHNSEFLDKLDLVEQRIRDLKNQLPNKAPQENKPSKVEALKDFIDNARFQVDYATKAKGTDTALKLIQQMIKDTNNTYEAKFLYRLKNEISSVKEAPKDIHFTDKKGKEHILTKEVQQQWLDTFNLKSLDDSYIPKHSDEILQALGGKEIKLQLGSLKKLVSQGREKYIPQIKEVLDSPEAIMRDDMGEYLFIKHLKNDDYFVNVSFDNGEYLISISNGIKETRNLNNKLKKGGSFIYQSPNFNSISQKLLQTSQYSANKIDSAIIPQSTQEIIKQAKASGKSVKETESKAQQKALNNETAENNANNAWQKEFIEKIKNDETGEILGYYPQGEALIVERKNDKELDLISITKEADGSLFATYLEKSITKEQAQELKSFLENGFKGKEQKLLKFLEKEPVNIGDFKLVFIPTLDKFFNLKPFNDNKFTEFFVQRHFGEAHIPYTSLGKVSQKANDNLYIYHLYRQAF
ncbi:PBECR2 nuclease fold domain-containing protein, partial [Helicobacter bilis]